MARTLIVCQTQTGDTQLDSVDKIMHSTPEFPEKTSELAKAFICQVGVVNPKESYCYISTFVNPSHHS